MTHSIANAMGNENGQSAAGPHHNEEQITLKIVLACSHWVGFPAMELLLAPNLLHGIIVPDQQSDSITRLQNTAHRHGIPLHGAPRKKDLGQLTGWLPLKEADALVVFAFPWQIPHSVLSMPRLGAYNFHTGSVPKYRGIEPIFWTIHDGAQKTAVSVLAMEHDLDTGHVVLSVPVPVSPVDTYGSLLHRYAAIGRTAMENLLFMLQKNEPIHGTPQPKGYFPLQHRPNPEELRILWKTQTTQQIYDLIRATNPTFNGASVTLRDIHFQILEAAIVQGKPSPKAIPGTVLGVDAPDGFIVACKDGALCIRIIRSQEGVFSGTRFTALYEIKRGELFLG
ncbi:MAG: hypothetical protein JXR76_13425 [Deltaproteobacteria bacterium]|nr:hypothetical protein [Deltaproteobacteria bacterium]